MATARVPTVPDLPTGTQLRILVRKTVKKYAIRNFCSEYGVLDFAGLLATNTLRCKYRVRFLNQFFP